MRHCLRLTIIFILLYRGDLSASIHETLPSWHWAYQTIEELRLRGGFEELNMMNRPFTRGDVAKGLIRIRRRLGDGKCSFTSWDRKLFERLVQEFQEEVNEIKGKTAGGNPISLGLRLQADLDKPEDEKEQYRGIYRSKISVPLGRHATVYNGINFNQYLLDDPEYTGKKWRGIAAYTEQAYAAVELGRFRFKCGRDFLRWGVGNQGTFLFSDVARPMDQLLCTFNLGPARYTFIASQLDDMGLDSVNTEKFGGSIANRFLSAHRLDLRFFHGRLQCSLSEVAIYGGVDRQFDFALLNPFAFYYLERADKSHSNTLGTLDVIFYPVNRIKIYGSLLVDHIANTGPKDLEPTEIGWMLGGRWADPVHIPGLTISGEYAGVTNRTYKTANPWEKFVHRNIVLGYPLENDFDRWQVWATQRIGGSLWFKLGYSIIRKGEGGVFTSWDRPWGGREEEDGFSEPFPTGIVGNHNQWSVEVEFILSVHWGVQTEFHSWSLDNAGHVQGESGRWIALD